MLKKSGSSGKLGMSSEMTAREKKLTQIGHLQMLIKGKIGLLSKGTNESQPQQNKEIKAKKTVEIDQVGRRKKESQIFESIILQSPKENESGIWKKQNFGKASEAQEIENSFLTFLNVKLFILRSRIFLFLYLMVISVLICAVLANSPTAMYIEIALMILLIALLVILQILIVKQNPSFSLENQKKIS